MQPSDYTEEQRRRNLRGIFLFTGWIGGVAIVSGVMQSWPLASYIAVAVVLGLIAALMYWLFVSSTARPLDADRDHARWPYWSKETDARIRKRKR